MIHLGVVGESKNAFLVDSRLPVITFSTRISDFIVRQLSFMRVFFWRTDEILILEVMTRGFHFQFNNFLLN